ncbi:uncharacterized protein METZ01_LOCUS45954 [marine metagenome]|uniref:Uncharacterized protein n=1 Tax=marine metagenome TaxID=408172 RepID=A0A381RMK7_9ZZZZ
MNNSTLPDTATGSPDLNFFFNSFTLSQIFAFIDPVLSRNLRSIYKSPLRLCLICFSKHKKKPCMESPSLNFSIDVMDFMAYEFSKNIMQSQEYQI